MTEADKEENARAIGELMKAPPDIVLKPSKWARLRRLSGEVALIIGITGIVIGTVGNSAAHRATQQARAACSIYKQIADAPLSPKTTDFGLAISAGSRIAYHGAGCKDGELKPADPRVARLLPPGVK